MDVTVEALIAQIKALRPDGREDGKIVPPLKEDTDFWIALLSGVFNQLPDHLLSKEQLSKLTTLAMRKTRRSGSHSQHVQGSSWMGGDDSAHAVASQSAHAGCEDESGFPNC